MIFIADQSINKIRTVACFDVESHNPFIVPQGNGGSKRLRLGCDADKH
jgi:hypothetical protein